MSSVPDSTDRLSTVAVFCSYSHKDEQHRKDFEAHVAMLRRENLIRIWQDRRIVAGSDWAGEIDSHLNEADIVTLFVSADFLNSDYCYEKEMKWALERHAGEKIPVVPIIVRPCDWTNAPFSHLQALPTNGKPITLWENRDEAWTVVANALRLTVQIVIERVQARLRERLRLEQLQQQSISYVPANSLNRVLNEMQQKINAIRDQVFGNASTADRYTYEHWYEYLKST